MLTAVDHLKLAAKQLNEERARCLLILLELHCAGLNGVTAQEAAAWLGMHEGRSSETTASIILHRLGYRKRARNIRRPDGKYDKEYRLFKGRPPADWANRADRGEVTYTHVIGHIHEVK